MRGHHLGYGTPRLGRCLDRVCFSTADLVQQRKGKKAVQVLIYVVMCSMAEDLFGLFYRTPAHSSYEAAQEGLLRPQWHGRGAAGAAVGAAEAALYELPPKRTCPATCTASASSLTRIR